MTRRELTLIAETRAALADGSARARREAARISVTEFAAAIGASPAAVSLIERLGPDGIPLRVPGTRLALAYGRALAALGQKAA